MGRSKERKGRKSHKAVARTDPERGEEGVTMGERWKERRGEYKGKERRLGASTAAQASNGRRETRRTAEANQTMIALTNNR